MRTRSSCARTSARSSRTRSSPSWTRCWSSTQKLRAAKTEASELRASRNALSKQIGMLMGQAKKDPSKLEEAEDDQGQGRARTPTRLAELEKLEAGVSRRKSHKIMMVIPQHDRPERPHRPGRQLQCRGASASASRLCPISRSPTTRRSWRASTASTWTPRAASPATGFYYLLRRHRPPARGRCSRMRATL